MAPPEAQATAAQIIEKKSAEETGLELRWSKCHLYVNQASISDFCSVRNSSFHAALTLHCDLNIYYPKAPIDDEFVNERLRPKVKKLQQITQYITTMEWKKEVITILKYCGTFCIVVYHILTIPLQETETLINEFHTIRSTHEILLGPSVGDKVWKMTEFPPFMEALDGARDYKLKAYNTELCFKICCRMGRIVPGCNLAENVIRMANEWIINHP